MPAYGVSDVERVLQMSRGTIRSLIKAGFVSPARGPRREYLFSFQDLIVLRTARALNAAKVPPRRITRSLKQLREHLPDQMPLSGLSIRAVGDRVVVQEGARRWQVDSGQYLLDLDVSVCGGELSLLDRTPELPSADAEQWFNRGWDLENAGVVPDIPIDNTPSDFAAGRDAQLLKAIEVVTQRVKDEARDWPVAPPYLDKTLKSFRQRKSGSKDRA